MAKVEALETVRKGVRAELRAWIRPVFGGQNVPTVALRGLVRHRFGHLRGFFAQSLVDRIGGLRATWGMSRPKRHQPRPKSSLNRNVSSTISHRFLRI